MLPCAVDIKTQRHSVAYSKDGIIRNVTLCFKYHGYNGGLSKKFKGSMTRDFGLQVFSQIIFPLAPEILLGPDTNRKLYSTILHVSQGFQKKFSDWMQ
jgi:hypothetical protein